MKPASFFFYFLFLTFAALYFGIPLARASEDSFDHAEWNQVLQEFAPNGRVDYARLQENRSLLDRYLNNIEALSLDRVGAFGREERLALWINLYNASVVRMVLDHLPLESVEHIPGFWNERTVRALGDRFSLSEIRDEILRKGFRDERIVTALVSGRMDSPRLLGRAFRGGTLNHDLNEAAARFVDDAELNRFGADRKKIYVSPLLKDFGKDFLLNFGNPAGEGKFSDWESAVISFILHHSQDAGKRLFLYGGKYKIEYLARDERLNEGIA